MRWLEQAIDRRDGLLPARPMLLATAVALLLVTQGLDLAAGAGPFAGRPLWVLHPLAVAAGSTLLGVTAAQVRSGEMLRAFAADAIRAAYVPLAVSVLAAALLLGPLDSTEGADGYVRDAESYGYLLNLVGWPQLSLPGVFEFNTVLETVNANVALAPAALLVWLGSICPARRRWRLLPLLLMLVLALAAVVAEAAGLLPDAVRELPGFLLRGDALGAVLGGLLGVTAFRERRAVPLSRRAAATAAGWIGVMAIVGAPSRADGALVRVALALPAAYGVVWLALRRTSGSRGARRVQGLLPILLMVSYPAQQVVAEQIPGASPFVQLALGLAATLALALLYWLPVGLWIRSARQRARAAREELIAEPRNSGRRPAGPWGVQLGWAGGVGLAFAVCLGVMAMIYVAMLPIPDGM